MKNKHYLALAILASTALLSGCGGAKATVSIEMDESIRTSAFTISEIKASLERNGLEYVENGGDYKVSISLDPSLGEQGYRISKDGNNILIGGGDPTGALYGGLQLAENINLSKGISNVEEAQGSPYIGIRGVRVRPTMDLRTPSYVNNGDSARANLENAWSLEYWDEFFSILARQRFNYMTFATLNSLPSMVVVPGYEQCALDDVWEYTGEYDDTYLGNATNMYRDEHAAQGNYRVLKSMSISEKIDHWKAVFKSAKDHGITVEYSTMNIYTFSENGKYGITHRRENDLTRDYFRKGLKAILDTYEDIDMFGTSSSENMDYPKDTYLETERWMRYVYGGAIEDAFEGSSDPRKDTFILNYTGELDAPTQDLWKDFDAKYLRGGHPRYSDTHMYALENPINNEANFDLMEELGLPESVKYVFNTRNEDAYHYTWGDPDFLRNYCRNMKKPRSRGYFLGSDGYFMGKEYEFKDESLNGKFYYDRHWINYTMFGRFTYDPSIDNDYIDSLVYDHFRDCDSEAIRLAWSAMKKASRFLIDLQKQFTLGGTDAAWYPGNCQSHPTMFGYIDVKRIVNSNNLFPGVEDLYSFAGYAKALQNNEVDPSKKTPFDTAASLLETANRTLEDVNAYLALNKGNSELDNIVYDQQTVAYLSKYYSSKFNGGMNLRLYNDSGDDSYKQQAIANQTQALEDWKAYSDSFHARFNVERLPRVGIIDPSSFIAGVEKDISTVSKWARKTY